AVPEPRREPVLLRARRLVRVLRAAAEAAPGLRHELVVARGAGAVGREVLAAGLALDDRPRDRPAALRRAGGRAPAAARRARGRRGGELAGRARPGGLEPDERALGPGPLRADARER